MNPGGSDVVSFHPHGSSLAMKEHLAVSLLGDGRIDIKTEAYAVYHLDRLGPPDFREEPVLGRWAGAERIVAEGGPGVCRSQAAVPATVGEQPQPDQRSLDAQRSPAGGAESLQAGALVCFCLWAGLEHSSCVLFPKLAPQPSLNSDHPIATQHTPFLFESAVWVSLVHR